MWWREVKEGVTLCLKVKPSAKSTDFMGISEDSNWLQIRIQAPPTDGKANAALLKFLGKTFKIPQWRLSITQGQFSHFKHVTIIDEKERNKVLICAIINLDKKQRIIHGFSRTPE